LAESDSEQPAYRWDDENLVLCIAVQPRASNNALVGIHGEQIKVRLTAPPVEGKANQALIKQLAQWFKVPVSQISIQQGQTSKRKIVHIKCPKHLPDFIKIP